MRNHPILEELNACRLCEGEIPEPKPDFRLSSTAKILVAGQAPGARVHKSGIPFTDPSGERLRGWMGVSEEEFYDEGRVAILPMGFCFPGTDAKSGDKPPPAKCARTWRDRLMLLLPDLDLILMIGGAAIRWHAPEIWTGRVTDAVASWKKAGEGRLPMPHPSWRNNAWLKQNPWFERDVVPELQKRVRTAFYG